MLVSMLGLPTISFATIDEESAHKVVMHVDESDPKKMNLVLNNASNLNKYYLDKGEEIMIEIVAYGPGLKMFMQNSPVKKRLKTISQNYDNVKFKACKNTMKKVARKTGKPVKLAPHVTTTASGVVHLIERQEQGWAYVRP